MDHPMIKEVILLIDDDPKQRYLFKYYLQDAISEYEWMFFPSEGVPFDSKLLDSIQKEIKGIERHHDLKAVMCDFNLGAVDAESMLKAIKKATLTRIIIMSGENCPKVQQLCKKYGADFILKDHIIMNPKAFYENCLMGRPSNQSHKYL